ncbi:hypothetical protein LPW36_01970 [Jinshanibacter sp. LJY008]|uniref:Uncharacterized protein n=1 Tax=Limnobaculum eriocheiris TaxID=2897391 RepID=A0A9X1MSN6_9GAMM|nr:hypothetical protein [Limnobaculum eriocheiris]MCD1124811.1 hypothetical protein [Limnobaculum eriocheiris]
MKENELKILFRRVLLSGLAAKNIIADVEQGYQPTQQGINPQPTIFFYLIHNHRYGSPKRTDKYDRDNNVIIHTETQWWESQFQISAISHQDPQDITSLTAGDLVSAASTILQSERGLAELKEGGAGIYRITDVKTPYFKNDRDQSEQLPMFDITLTHKDIHVTETPTVESYSLNITGV